MSFTAALLENIVPREPGLLPLKILRSTPDVVERDAAQDGGRAVKGF